MCLYPMPWQAGCKSLGAICQNIAVCGINMRDHDFGTEFKNETRSYFPYMFLDQLV